MEPIAAHRRSDSQRGARAHPGRTANRTPRRRSAPISTRPGPREAPSFRRLHRTMDSLAARRRPLHLAALGATGVAALLFILGVVPLPDVDGALEDASRTLGGWAYPA